MINYFDAIKIRHAKSHLEVMHCVVHASGYTIFYFSIPHLEFIILVCFLFIMIPVAPLSHKHVRPSTVVALCLLPPQRETVTTGKGSLVPLDKLKLLVSIVGSLLMASLS